MEKGEWLVVFFLFSVLYVFTSSVTANHLTGYAGQDNNQTNQTNQTDYVRTVRANRTIEVNLTHLECLNQACVVMNGTGADLCKTNQDCLNQTNITHLECVNLACVQVPGNATDQCRTSLDCQNQTNMSGNGGDAVAAGLPLAPPPQTESKEPTTLARIIAGTIVQVFQYLFGG